MVCTSDWCKITSIPRHAQYPKKVFFKIITHNIHNCIDENSTPFHNEMLFEIFIKI